MPGRSVKLSVSLECLRWAYSLAVARVRYYEEFGYYVWTSAEYERDTRLLAELKAALDGAENEEEDA